MKSGKPRQLHIEEGLRIIDPKKQAGPSFVDSIRRSPTSLSLPSGGKCLRYPGNEFYKVDLLNLSEGDSVNIDIRAGYGVIVQLKGHMTASNSATYDINIIKGQPVMLPHAALPVSINARVDSRFALIAPAGATVSFR